VRAVRFANRAIHDAARRDPKLHGMGTTCTALVLRGGLAYCAHVGDSRLYLIRDGEIFLMTEDHSAVMDMVRRGLLTRDEARRHPDKNVIVRALGGRREVEVSAWPQPLSVRAGDRFLLSSDGLHDLVEDDELQRAAALDPHAACERLVALARERGGHDNISVAIVAMRPLDGAAAGGGSTVRETRALESVS
jgi:protein phosphatase